MGNNLKDAKDKVLCNICQRREAFYHRPYSGEKLCRRCFGRSIEEKVRATISQHDMFQYNDRIAVAVSGGKDSLGLLHILAKIEQDYPKVSLTAITIDEGIREYRDEALEITVENCKVLGIEHYTLSFRELYGHTMDEIASNLKQTRRAKLTPCAYCGVLRRKALNIAARKVKADKIATAHTLDDESQTFLLNMVHGNLSRMARESSSTDGSHPKLVQRVKPFCEIPERDTALYSYVKGMRFQSIQCPYASEALRNDIRSFLNRMEQKHPGIKFTIFRSAERISRALRETSTEEKLSECVNCGEPASENLCKACEMFRKLFDDVSKS